MSETVDVLAAADDATLDLIKREADAYLAAQLTVALAGNQRAMTFFGFLATASAVIGGGSLTAFAAHGNTTPIAWVGILVVAGFLVAMLLANLVAMPDAFEYVGNTPTSWLEDIENKKPITRSKAESLAESAQCIDKNKRVLDRSASLIRAAVWTAWGSLIAGAIVSALFEVLQRAGLL